MHAHDWESADVESARRGTEAARDQDAGLHGLAERRPDVLGSAALLRLQREAGNGAVSDLVEEQRSPVLDVVSSGGSPLEPTVRTDMESRLGHDFGDVRVHTDAAAHDSAKSVGAHAYTVGSNVVFQRDAYDPSSQAGRTTLAHELTHVVQQRSGPVDGTLAGGGVSVSDPSDRFERAAADTATRAMSEPAPVQRQEEEPEEEESVQGSFVQRQETEEEEEEAAS
ncbi:eCIS core domain-containing protein [Agromyces bauzanensis]